MKSVNGVNGVRLAKLGYARVKGSGPFFHLFFKRAFEMPSIINDFACYLGKKRLP